MRSQFATASAPDPNMRSQFVTSNLRSQNATSSRGSHGGRRYLPYAFTEHGALMAASVLNTPRAMAVSILRHMGFRQAARIIVRPQGTGRQACGAGAQGRVARRGDPQSGGRHPPVDGPPARATPPADRIPRQSRRYPMRQCSLFPEGKWSQIATAGEWHAVARSQAFAPVAQIKQFHRVHDAEGEFSLADLAANLEETAGV
jgi:hypothetical protein